MLKKALSVIAAISIMVSGMVFPVSAQSEPVEFNEVDTSINLSRQLIVSGNKLVYENTGEAVTLRGANVPSLGWGMAEHLYESAVEMYDAWNANVIRLPIQPKYWYNGVNEENKPTMTSDKYREWVDGMVKAAMARGKYIILDCHQYVLPQEDTVQLWKNLSVIYGNNPAVLFGLFNEPHGIGWDEWYYGDSENGYIGHQELVETIRDTGAKNILIAGGTNWAYDISGIVNGYMLKDQGSNADTSKAGYGIMYDTHIYPSKGNRDGWDAVIGPVRKIAPVLVGEWGWDSGDSAVVGNSVSTYEIYMTQLEQWMEDDYGDYGGVPLNYTAWNLHMSSSPKMILDWSFRPTAFNGAYIKDALLSHESTALLRDGKYTVDYTGNTDRFIGYTNTEAQTSVNDEKLTVSYNGAPEEGGTVQYSTRMLIPEDWDLNGIQTLKMDIIGEAGKTVNIGFYGTDMEIWTKEVTLTGSVQNLEISIDEFEKQGNPRTDGKLTPAINSIYIGGETETAGTIEIDNIVIEKMAEPVKFPVDSPYEVTPNDMKFDLDTLDFVSFTKNNGADTSYVNYDYETVPGVDGEDTKALKISYLYTGAYAGYLKCMFPEGQTPAGARYLSICAKGDGTAQEIKMDFLGRSYSFTIAEGDNEWRQYVFDLKEYITDPEDIDSIQFGFRTKVETSVLVDNISFTKDYPEKLCSYKEGTAAYGFERVANKAKMDPVYTVIPGGEGDSIQGTVLEDGYQSSKGYNISYTRGSGEAAIQEISYTSSDFFKTQSRPNFSANMALATDLIFDGKSTSGKDEKINLSMISAIGKTYTESVTFTLTDEWQRFRIPIRSMLIEDCGVPMPSNRIRGFRISSAETNTSGSFTVDNFILTSVDDYSDESYKACYVNTFDDDVYENNGAVWTENSTTSDGNYIVSGKTSDGGFEGSAGLHISSEKATTSQTITIENPFPEDWDMSKAFYVGAMVKAESLSCPSKSKQDHAQTDLVFILYNNDKKLATANLNIVRGSWNWSEGEFNLAADLSDETLRGANKLVIYYNNNMGISSEVYLDNLTFSYIPQSENKKLITDPADYYESFESGALSFSSGLEESTSLYMKNPDSKSLIGDGGCPVQYILNQDIYDLGNIPHMDASIPASWDITRSKYLSFTAALFNAESNNWIWRTKNSVPYNETGSQSWHETLTPVFALSDMYGHEYKASVTLNTNENTLYTIPLEDFVDDEGNKADLSKITTVSVYPDTSVYSAAFIMDNFGFSNSESPVTPSPSPTVAPTPAPTQTAGPSPSASAEPTPTVPTEPTEAPVVTKEPIVKTQYVDQNFDDAVMDITPFITDEETGAWSVPPQEPVTINTKNAVTGENLPWYTYNNDSKNSKTGYGYFMSPVEVGTNDDGTSDKALTMIDRGQNGRKRSACINFYMQEMGNDGVLTDAPVTSAGEEKLNIEIAVERISPALDDAVTMNFNDSSGKTIFAIEYTQNKYPKLIASQSYGGEDSSTVSAANYPFGDGWEYIRAVIDFDTKTFELYVGDSRDNMKPYINGVSSYGFKTSTAADFYNVYVGYKGSIGVDDFKVYTTVPAPEYSVLAMIQGDLGEENALIEGNAYGASVLVSNPSDTEEDLCLISAWYDTSTGLLEDIVINTFKVPAKTEGATYNGDTKTVTEAEGKTLKVYAFNSISSMYPLSKPVSTGK